MKTTIYLSESTRGVEVLTQHKISIREAERIAEQLAEAQLDPNHTFYFTGEIKGDNGEPIGYAADADEIVAAQQSA